MEARIASLTEEVAALRKQLAEANELIELKNEGLRQCAKRFQEIADHLHEVKAIVDKKDRN